MAVGNWKTVAATLAAKIENGDYEPGARLPSGDAFAKELGVNRNVVHRALEDLQRKGLVIRRQGSGTVVAEKAGTKPLRVAVLVDGYSAEHNFPSGDLLEGIQDGLGEETTLVIADSKHEVHLEAKQLRRLVKETDGILIYACSPDHSAAIKSVVESGFPIVALDRKPIGVEIDVAMSANQKAVEKSIEVLVARGHKEIAFLAMDKPSFSTVVDRERGYEAAMSAAGLDAKKLVRWLPERSNKTPEMLERLVRDTLLGLKQDSNYTAVFCAEDGLGCSAVAACDQLGISIPNDLEIATFIDWHPMTLRRPWMIHRIVQRKYEIGHAGAGLLLERIASPDKPCRVVEVDAELITPDEVPSGSSSMTHNEVTTTKAGQ